MKGQWGQENRKDEDPLTVEESEDAEAVFSVEGISSGLFLGVEGGDRMVAEVVVAAAAATVAVATFKRLVLLVEVDEVVEDAEDDTDALLLDRRSLLAGPL